MTKRKGKTPGKETPKRSEEENPAMDEAEINRYLKNALDQLNAQHEAKLKEMEVKLTKKFNDEKIELHTA